MSNSQTSEPTMETHEIQTLEDMMEVPEDRIDAFLEDLRSFLKMSSMTKDLFEALNIVLDEEVLIEDDESTAVAMKKFGWGGKMFWLDDGDPTQTVVLKGPDGEELAELDVGRNQE